MAHHLRLLPLALAATFAAGGASAGLMTTTQTFSMDASTGFTSFTVPAFQLTGQRLTGVTVSLGGSLNASAVAANTSPDHLIFVTAGYTAAYQLTGPGGVFLTNTPTTTSASGAVAQARLGVPGMLLVPGSGSAPEVFFRTASSLGEFEGPADPSFSLTSTALSATTTCNIVVPGPRPDCGLSGNSFGPVTGIDTVTAKVSYSYSADPNYVPPAPPAPPPIVPVPQSVPEPGTIALLSAGVFGLGMLRRGRAPRGGALVQ